MYFSMAANHSIWDPARWDSSLLKRHGQWCASDQRRYIFFAVVPSRRGIAYNPSASGSVLYMHEIQTVTPTFSRLSDSLDSMPTSIGIGNTRWPSINRKLLCHSFKNWQILESNACSHVFTVAHFTDISRHRKFMVATVRPEVSNSNAVENTEVLYSSGCSHVFAVTLWVYSEPQRAKDVTHNFTSMTQKSKRASFINVISRTFGIYWVGLLLLLVCNSSVGWWQ